MPPGTLLGQYAEWTRGKLHLAAEYARSPLHPFVIVGSTTIPVPFDQRAWYPMVDYRATRRLQVGSYYSYYLNKAGGPVRCPQTIRRTGSSRGGTTSTNIFTAKSKATFSTERGWGTTRV
jgi:hypothetical protein